MFKLVLFALLFGNTCANLEEMISNLQTLVEKRFNHMENEMREGFHGLHMFPLNKIKVLESVSEGLSITECYKNYQTRHTVYYNGKVAQLFAPHLKCDNLTGNYTGVFISYKYDLAMLTGCPTTKFALDLSVSVEPELGDEVICLGFGEIADVWSGYVSKKINVPVVGLCDGFTPWRGNATQCEGEFLLQAHQHAGMSGAAVANSCGYTGMVHTVVTNNASTGFAGVIGASVIKKFLSDLWHEMKDISECPGLKPIKLPTAQYVNCLGSHDATSSSVVAQPVP